MLGKRREVGCAMSTWCRKWRHCQPAMVVGPCCGDVAVTVIEAPQAAWARVWNFPVGVCRLPIAVDATTAAKTTGRSARVCDSGCPNPPVTVA